MSIDLSAIRLSLEDFDKARWEYEIRYMREEPIKEEAIELRRCALELATLLEWTEKEGGRLTIGPCVRCGLGSTTKDAYGSWNHNGCNIIKDQHGKP